MEEEAGANRSPDPNNVLERDPTAGGFGTSPGTAPAQLGPRTGPGPAGLSDVEIRTVVVPLCCLWRSAAGLQRRGFEHSKSLSKYKLRKAKKTN